MPSGGQAIACEEAMLKLFYTPHTSALATHIVLEEVGATYEIALIDFEKNEQRSPEYLKINPRGRVPSLVTNSGVLTETPALLVYLAQLFPQSRHAPIDDPYLFAELQSFNSFICSNLHVAHSHRMRGHRWADEPAAIEAMKRKVPQTVKVAFEQVERHLLRGPWVLGEQYTVSDAYLFTMAQWMEADGVDPSSFPKVLDHRNRMSLRPAVRNALRQELGDQ